MQGQHEPRSLIRQLIARRPRLHLMSASSPPPSKRCIVRSSPLMPTALPLTSAHLSAYQQTATLPQVPLPALRCSKSAYNPHGMHTPSPGNSALVWPCSAVAVQANLRLRRLPRSTGRPVGTRTSAGYV